MTRCCDDDNIEYADSNDDQVGNDNDDISESLLYFHILYYDHGKTSQEEGKYFSPHANWHD